MFLLDTNVVSEVRKTRTPKIDVNVEQWWSKAELSRFYLSVITVMELEEGVLQMERRDARQGRALRSWVERVVTMFEARTLPVTPAIARACAALQVPDKRPYADALIAATARVHGLKIVTRNVADFQGAGVDIIDPWLRAP